MKNIRGGGAFEYPFNEIESKLDCEELLNLIPDKFSTIIKLKYLEGYTLKEISENLRISHENVKKIHQRGIVRLREKVKIISDDCPYF